MTEMSISTLLANLPDQEDLPELPEGHQGNAGGPEYDLLRLTTSTGRKCDNESGWTVGETNEPVDKQSLWALDITQFQWGFFGFGEDRSKGPVAKWANFLDPLPENPDPAICRQAYRMVLTCVQGAQAGTTAEYAASNSGMLQNGKVLAQKAYQKIREAKQMAERDPAKAEFAKINPVVVLGHGEFQAKKGPGKGKWFLKPSFTIVGYTDRFLSDYPAVSPVKVAPAEQQLESGGDDQPSGRRKVPD